MGGSSQSAFKLNLYTFSPEPGAWALIEASRNPTLRLAIQEWQLGAQDL